MQGGLPESDLGQRQVVVSAQDVILDILTTGRGRETGLLSAVWELYICIHTLYTTFLTIPTCTCTYHDAYVTLRYVTLRYVTLRYLGYNHLPPYPSIHPAIRPLATLLHRLIPFLPPPTQPHPRPPLPATTTHAPVHGAVCVKDRYRYGPYGRPCAGVCTQQLCGATLGGQHVGCAAAGAGAGVCIWPGGGI
jgi:hypothetical protein